MFVNNVLVHSKTTQNEGFVDTNLKEENLYNLIKKALNGDSLGDEEEDDATSYGTMLTLDTDDEANSKTENEAAERKSLIFSIATYVNFVSIYNIFIYIININNNNQNITNNTIQYILHSLVLSIPALIGA